MQTDNSVAFKVFVTDGKGDAEVRRFSVDKCAVTSFEYMKAKIQSVFPSISEGAFTLSWKDEEGDEVLISSDEELILALSSIRDDLKKLYVKKRPTRMPDVSMIDVPVMEIPVNIGVGQFFSPPQCGSAGKKRTFDANGAHPGVTCDGCQGSVVGYRYKCVVCDDFDLCSGCEQKNLHSEHYMMRIPVPVGYLGNRISKVFSKVMKRMGDYEEASEARECNYTSKRCRKERCAENESKHGHQKGHGKHGSRHEEKRKHYEEKRQRRDGHHHMNGGWLNTFTNYMNEFANLAGDIGAQAATAAAGNAGAAAGNMGATTNTTAGNATASASASASTAQFSAPPSTPQPSEQQTSNNNAPNGNEAFNSAKAAHDLHIQYMQNVGRTVAKMLDPLGINVDFEIRPKPSETNVQSQSTQSNENDIPKPNETVTKKSPVVEIKDGSSSSSDDDSSDSDAGQKPEGWTFIHPKEGAKKTEGNTRKVGFDLDKMTQEFQKQMEIHAQAINNPNQPTTSTSTGIYPTIPLPDASAPMEVTNEAVPNPSIPVNIPISVPVPSPRINNLRPEIAESYNRMLAMGFKDEGDRLVRLLESKNGNINEVLDVLSMHIPRV